MGQLNNCVITQFMVGEDGISEQVRDHAPELFDKCGNWTTANVCSSGLGQVGLANRCKRLHLERRENRSGKPTNGNWTRWISEQVETLPPEKPHRKTNQR